MPGEQRSPARVRGHEGRQGPAAPPNGRPDPDTAQTRIVVPGAHSMVSLLGSRDELLRIIERAFDSDIHVRGNEITVTGEPAENAAVAQLFEELSALLSSGTVLTAEPGKACDLAIWDVERPAELVYRMGFNPLHARVWKGEIA